MWEWGLGGPVGILEGAGGSGGDFGGALGVECGNGNWGGLGEVHIYRGGSAGERIDRGLQRGVHPDTAPLPAPGLWQAAHRVQ